MNDIQKAEIYKLRAEGYGYTKIANSLGIALSTVKSHCRRHNLGCSIQYVKESIKNNLHEETLIFCELRGREVQQTQGRKRKRFCSDACRNKWWNSHLHLVKRKAVYKYRCPVCSEIYEVYGNSHRKYCSHGCYIIARFKMVAR